MRLQSKLTLAHGAMAGLAALLAVVFFATIERVRSEFDLLHVQASAVITSLGEIRAAGTTLVTASEKLAEPSPRSAGDGAAAPLPNAGPDRERRRIQEASARLRAALEDYARMVEAHFLPAEGRFLDEITRASQSLLAMTADLAAGPAASGAVGRGPPPPVEAIVAQANALARFVSAALDYERQEAQGRRDAVGAAAVSAERAALVAGLLVLVGVFVLGHVAARAITRPVGELKAAAAIGRGAFDTPVAAHGRDEIGELAGSFHAMARDLERMTVRLEAEVAERRLAEAESRAATLRAEVANRAKSQFLASMSHELRTPLNAIIGFSQLIELELSGAGGDPKLRRYGGYVLEAGEHLLQLINDILDLAKIEARRFELHQGNVDVAQAIGSCLALIEPRVEAGGLRLESRLPSALPPLYADERRFKQVVINLVSNAVKFTPSGGTVAVSARFGRECGYLLEITDTGVGMSLDEIAKAMEPYGQVGGTPGQREAGTGLGLVLAKSLVEMHGGTLVLRSQPGAGTTAAVRFPAWRIVSGEKAVAAPASPPALGTAGG